MKLYHQQVNDKLVYGLPIIFVALFVLLNFWFIEVYNLRNITLLVTLPILLSAWLGQWKSGLVATVLTTLAFDFFFLEPLYSLSFGLLEPSLRVGAFFIQSLILVAVLQVMHNALKREYSKTVLLEESQDQLKSVNNQITTILDTVTDAFFSFDSEWNITYLNPQAQRLLDTHLDEVIGKNVWTAFPFLMDTNFYHKCHGALEKQKLVEYKDFWPRSKKWLFFKIYASDQGLTIYGTDITRRRLVEEKLRVAQEQFKKLTDSDVIGVIVADLEGNIHEANDLFLKMVGYTREDLRKGKVSWKGMTPPEFESIDREGIQDLLKSGEMQPVEKEYLRKDGSRVPVFVGAVLLDKELQHTLAFVLDLSEIKQTRLALKESEDRFKFFVSEVREYAIFLLDPEGYIETWNVGAERILKYTEADAIGKHLSLLYNTEDRKKGLPQRMLELAQAEGQAGTEHTFVTKDGKEFWGSGVITPIYDERGVLKGYSKIMRDRTEQRALDQRKNEFISTASHELKTPVATIKAFNQLLQKHALQQKDTLSEQYLAKMSDYIEKLTELIGELLDVSTMETGKISFKEEVFAIDELVNEAVGDIQQTTPEHTLIKQGQSLARVQGDRNRLSQVLSNLINNAVKYSPLADRVVISIQESQKETVQISVQDFGIGIPKDKLNKIFQRFYRVSDPSVKAFPGMGLGLYISQYIIKRHQGKMWVESEEGKGATFFLELPVLREIKSPKSERKTTKRKES